nr:gamma-glutamyltransferase [Ramlibacter sp.]
MQPGHANEVGPRKQPFHTIIPGFATRGGAPLMAFGVMGGPIQPQAHVQVLARMLLYRQNPQAALDAPRWRIEPGHGLYTEPEFPAAWRDGLAQRGHAFLLVTDPALEFGAGQVVWRLPGGGWGAASDWRRDGHAAGR